MIINHWPLSTICLRVSFQVFGSSCGNDLLMLALRNRWRKFAPLDQTAVLLVVPCKTRNMYRMVKKILVADDDPDMRFILDQVLKEAGYAVEPIPSGHTIIEGNLEWPDLFILDKSLPVIDGIALCKYLKLKKETRNIPIIMMSSYHKLKNKAKDVGVAAFIEKPFDVKLLLEVIEQQLQQRSQ